MALMGRLDLFCFMLLFLLFLYTSRVVIVQRIVSTLSGSIFVTDKDIEYYLKKEEIQKNSKEANQQQEEEETNKPYFRSLVPPNTQHIVASSKVLVDYQEPDISSSPDWDTFASTLQKDATQALTPVENDWRYMENFCIFESNKSIYLINNNKLYPTKRYPPAPYTWYYKRYLYFRNNTLTDFPANMTVVDDLYVFITRGWGGWNNIYHHTEWIHNLLRYIHKASSLPQMKHVMYYPDLISQNQTFGDPKGHYQWGVEYYKLAKRAFPPDLLPHFIEGEEYAKMGFQICARRGILARIVPTMYDSFINTYEPVFMKLLAYKHYHIPLRIDKPKKLDVLYLYRNDSKRGIKNTEEILNCIKNHTDIHLIIQENKPMTFDEQVLNVVKRDIYISIHGAAMTHILFMEPFGALIEFNPPNFHEQFYRNMARKTRLLFYGIYKTYTENMKYSMTVSQTEKKLNQIFTVPLELFKHTFSLAVKNVWEMKYKLVTI